MILAWLAVAPCVSCSRVDPPAGPAARRIVARLAEDDPHGAPGHMTIQGVMRYVLALPGLTFLYMEPSKRPELRATGQGAIELSIPCPDVLRGRDIVAYVGLVQPHEQVNHCPDTAGEPLALRFEGFAPDEAVFGIVLARELPVNHIETRAHLVGPGATLELAIAHVAAEPPQRATPSWVHIMAQGADGRAETLLDRTLDPAARPADRGWVDLQLPLDAVRAALGPDLRFIFESGPDQGSLRPGPPVWWVDPTIFEPRAERHEAVPRNVVLVSIDTLRPDRLGFYGAVRPTSPVLDSLAADGTVFDVAVAQAPWTLPSHATMLTGLYGCVHGAVEGVASRLTQGVVPLASILRDAGYTTAAFTEDGFVLADVFSAGFGRYQEHGNSLVSQIDQTVAAAVDWLRGNPNQPFFLFLHTYQTHGPYTVPPSFLPMFAAASDPATAPGVGRAPDREEKLARYDRAIRYADTVLGQLFDELDHLGLTDRTLVVVTSDHGEAFGEHGYDGHGRTMHDEVLRVPLLFRAPGLVASGRHVSGMVGLIDLVPTLLDLLSIEPRYALQGISLASLVRTGSAPGRAPSRVLFSENELHHRRVAARSDRWKILFDESTLEVFDLAADPGEREARPAGMIGVEPEVVRRSFEEECARARASLPHGGSTTTLPALPDPERERNLKALGYVQ